MSFRILYHYTLAFDISFDLLKKYIQMVVVVVVIDKK